MELFKPSPNLARADLNRLENLPMGKSPHTGLEGVAPCFSIVQQGGGRLARDALDYGVFNVPELGLDLRQLQFQPPSSLTLRGVEGIEVLLYRSHEILHGGRM